MSTTNTSDIPDSTGLTFEKIWMLFRETDRKMQETDERMRETDEKMRETDRKMQETDKELRELFKETDRRMKETDRMIKRLSKQFGDVGKRFGELAEHLVAPGIVRIFNEQGYHFHEVSSNIEIKDDNNRTLAEIDLLLDNDDVTVIVEVKAKPTINDIPHHITRLNILREHFKKHKKADKKIIGAIAGAIFDKDIKATAIEAGFYTITQSGDTVKIDVPADFQPRIF
jgi:hypothetical protein